MDNTQNLQDPTALAVVRALGYTENGGKPDLDNLQAGQSGELKSIFQFTPDTWKHDSAQVFGKELPLTPDNESYLMYQKVSKQLSQGYSPQQIASMHNAGIGEPNAYGGTFSNGQPSVGTNKHGVKFDVPGYVGKFTKYFDKFNTSPAQSEQSTQSSQATPTPKTPALALSKNSTTGLVKPALTKKVSKNTINGVQKDTVSHKTA